MHTAEALAHAVRQHGRGIFFLTWREKGDLARALLVFLAALGEQPSRSHLVRTDILPRELAAELECRQGHDDTLGVVAGGERTSGSRDMETLLLIFLDLAVGRSIAHVLNGWRRGLAQPLGSLIVLREAELGAFRRQAPDLASFALAQHAHADSLLALWSPDTAARLDRWLATGLPALPTAVDELTGGELDRDELRAWVRLHLAPGAAE